MTRDWISLIFTAVLCAAVGWNLRSGIKTRRIQYGHVFGRRFYVDELVQPGPFKILVAIHVFLLIAGGVSVIELLF